MRISPLDVRRQTFKKSMRGVDAEEVRIFLEVVASEYEKVLQENAMMTERLHYQDERLAEYRELEKSMRNSLVTAERIASESRDVSEREAARILQDAHARAERILEDARDRLQTLVREIEVLKGKKEVYARRFWALVDAHVGVLQEHMQDSGEVDAIRKKVEQLVREPISDEAGGWVGAAASEPEEDLTGTTPQGYDDEPENGRPEFWERSYGDDGPSAGDLADESIGTSSSYFHADSGDADRLGMPGEAGDDGSGPAARGIGRLPRGLARLLRGRQQHLPLDREGHGDSDQPGAPEDEDQAESFFPLAERKEGFFEIRAGERRAQPLDDPDTGPNGRR